MLASLRPKHTRISYENPNLVDTNHEELLLFNLHNLDLSFALQKSIPHKQ